MTQPRQIPTKPGARRRQPIAVILLALVLGSSSSTHAITPVFVRTDGDDTVCDGSADAAVAAAPSCAFASLARAILEVDSGGEIRVGAGTFDDTAQVVFDKSVTVQGSGQAATTFTHTTFDTGSSGDARGWWLVLPGSVVHVRDLTLDGGGRLTYQGVRHRGSGSFQRVTFRDIRYLESTAYQGTAVVAFGDGPTDFDDCVFTGIGRVGVLFFGTGINLSTVSDSFYTGKGAGDFLDYAFELGAGAIVNILNTVISDNLGEASSDGSKSAGVLASTFSGPGTFATLTGNDISNCTCGVSIGVDAGSDTSGALVTGNNIHRNVGPGIDVSGSATADIRRNCVTENGTGIQFAPDASGMTRNNNIVDNLVGAAYSGVSTGLDFEDNWWARASGPSGDGPGTGDSVDGTSGGGSIDFTPFLITPDPNTPTCDVLPVRLRSFSID